MPTGDRGSDGEGGHECQINEFGKKLAAELLLQEADEAAALKAVEQFKWPSPPHYYMFSRKISGWSKAEEVQTDISDI